MRPEVLSSYSCRFGGEPATAAVTKDALVLGAHTISWLDIDEVVVDDHTARLRLPDGAVVELTHLGRTRDDFLRDLRAAREPVRRAALLQWGASAPIDTFSTKDERGETFIRLFAEGVVVEPPTGPPEFAPLALVERVERDGYVITLVLRGLDPVVVRRLGKRTDEFLIDLDKARAQLAARTADAFAELEPALAGLDVPDGWAVDAGATGARWAALRAAVARRARAAEIAVLESLAGPRLRLGVKTTAGAKSMPFALAPVGGKVAVESADEEARATFVFATEDVDRLNAALLLTNFRREAISLPENELGRWAVAARCLEVVRWARSVLAARVVHDAAWEANVRAALG